MDCAETKSKVVPKKNTPCAAISFTDIAIQMAISWATSELGYSALRPKQELSVSHFLRGSDVFVSLPKGSYKSLCYCLLSRAFDFSSSSRCTPLRPPRRFTCYISSCNFPLMSFSSSLSPQAVYGTVFEPRKSTSRNLSALPKTLATTCFKSGKQTHWKN